jgi:hypothetical protein
MTKVKFDDLQVIAWDGYLFDYVGAHVCRATFTFFREKKHARTHASKNENNKNNNTHPVLQRHWGSIGMHTQNLRIVHNFNRLEGGLMVCDSLEPFFLCVYRRVSRRTTTRHLQQAVVSMRVRT